MCVRVCVSVCQQRLCVSADCACYQHFGLILWHAALKLKVKNAFQVLKWWSANCLPLSFTLFSVCVCAAYYFALIAPIRAADQTHYPFPANSPSLSMTALSISLAALKSRQQNFMRSRVWVTPRIVCKWKSMTLFTVTCVSVCVRVCVWCVNGISCVVMCLKLVNVIRLTGRGICRKYEQIILKINNRNLQKDKGNCYVYVFMLWK